MDSKNKAILSGNVGKAPKSRWFGQQYRIVDFWLGITQELINPDGVKFNDTQWLKIVCSGNLADFVDQNICSGDFVNIEGRICTRKNFDKEGFAHYFTEIEADKIDILAKAEKETLIVQADNEGFPGGDIDQIPEFLQPDNDDVLPF